MFVGSNPTVQTMAKEEKKITVTAEVELVSPDGREVIRTFSKGWERALDLPRPVKHCFLGYVRIDEK